MQLTKLALALALVTSLSGCLTEDAQRGLIGAAGGAVISDLTGGNAATGALVGGVGGLLCDDVGVCR